MTVFRPPLQVKLVGPFFKRFASNSYVLMVQHVFIPPVCDCRIACHSRLLLSAVQNQQPDKHVAPYLLSSDGRSAKLLGGRFFQMTAEPVDATVPQYR